MADPDISVVSDELQDQMDAEIQAEEERTGLKCCLLERIDPDECPNPTMEDLRAIPKIFVRETAMLHMERIGHDLSMIGQSDEGESSSTTNVKHLSDFFAIFRSEIKNCSNKYSERKFAECMDQMIAIILGLKDFSTGFTDIEDAQIHCSYFPTRQHILNKIAELWKNAVDSNHGLSEDTISVLYDVMTDIGEELDGYQFNVGAYRGTDPSNDDDQSSDVDDREDGQSRYRRIGPSIQNSKRRRSSTDDEDGDDGNESDENPKPRQRRRIS